MKKATLLWLDLEMTGLDPKKDKILEDAAIAIDMKLNEIATYEAVIKVSDRLIKSRMVGEVSLLPDWTNKKPGWKPSGFFQNQLSVNQTVPAMKSTSQFMERISS